MYIGAASVAFAVLLVAVLLWYTRKRYREASEEVLMLYPQHSRELSSPMANFFGTKSAGMKQVRGNGILILTDSVVYFRMLVPRREVIIPLERINSIKTPRSFLGKSKGGKLLQLDYTNETGGEDAAAWMVSGLQEWLDKLKTMTGSPRM